MKNSTNKTSNRNAAFNVVNEQVLAGLKAEGLKWFKPWRMPNGDIYSPMNWVSGRAYSGINSLLLSAVARTEGYSSGEWATFKNISDNGGQIRKGEKGTGIVFWCRSFKNKETGAFYSTEKQLRKAGFSPSDKVIEDIWSLRYYKVFNIEQADGIDSKIPADNEPAEVSPIPRAEDIYNNYSSAPKLKHGGNEAYYSPAFDKVQMPEAKYFVDVDSYYKTLFHELIHSTGHEDRLKREGIVKHDGFGSELYSKEELVAEIGAWYLTGLCDLDPKDSEFNSQAYINGWVKKLEDKEREVVYAISQAQKAVNHILEGKGAETPEPPKKAKKEPVLASSQVTVERSRYDVAIVEQCKLDVKAVDYCLNHFNLNEDAKRQLNSIRDEAVQDLLHTKNKADKIQKLIVEAEDPQNETSLQKYLENIYQKTAVKLLDFTIWDALKNDAIATAEVNEEEYYYIYNTSFAGEPAIGYVNMYRNEFKLHSKQVTVRQVAKAVEDTSNYFDKGSLRFFNQSLSDFEIESIGGGKYFLYAPSFWDGRLMGYSCIIFNSNENILESVNVDDSEKSSVDAISELIERYRTENEVKHYSKQVTIKQVEEIAQDILSDDEWVQDSHDAKEYKGRKEAIEELLSKLDDLFDPNLIYSNQITLKTEEIDIPYGRIFNKIEDFVLQVVEEEAIYQAIFSGSKRVYVNGFEKVLGRKVLEDIIKRQYS